MGVYQNEEIGTPSSYSIFFAAISGIPRATICVSSLKFYK